VQQLLSRHTRTATDEFGTFYAWLEGSHGGQTVLVWLEEGQVEAVLQGLQKLRFKGRIVLAIHGWPGLTTPFARALHWAAAHKALIVTEGQGIGSQFAGGKKLEDGTWAAWDDPQPGPVLSYRASTGLEFSEHQTYTPWQQPVPYNIPTLPEGPAIAGRVGVPSYGLGLIGLEASLSALLRTWHLLEE
jgi:hypothetical protein